MATQGQAAQRRVKGDCLEIGKWQNSTGYSIKAPKQIAKKLPWLIRS